MSLVQFLSTYLNLNLLILVGFVGLILTTWLLRLLQQNLKARTELRLHYFVLICIFALAIAHPFLPKSEIIYPGVKVWSAHSMKTFNSSYSALDKGGYLIFPTPKGEKSIAAENLSHFWLYLAGIIFILSTVLMGRDLFRLFRLEKNSFLVRRIGRVRIHLNESDRVPLSYWRPGRAIIILPYALASRPTEQKMAIAHEIQHHRQKDTKWVYLLWSLRWICLLNPAVYFWNRWIAEIQEFACDETLVDHGKVESQAYARCLVEVAQFAIAQKFEPVCATGLTFLRERNILKRRIEMMIQGGNAKGSRPTGIIVGILLAAVMSVTTYASRGFVQDRRVTLAEAKAMALRAQGDSGFSVVVNEKVVKQLNRYIGTPEGRQQMREALARMTRYRNMVVKKIESYGLPEELLAVPLIESGYQNLPEAKNSAYPTWKAAGVWQFVRQTARNYGLVVNDQTDERLNVEVLTDAAMRYLQANNLRFKDWHLSALAYNMGESAVQKGIEATGQRDAWTLIRNGHEGDKDYLPKLMAAILIMKNPRSVE